MESQFWHNCWAEKKIGFHQTDFNDTLLNVWPKFNLRTPGAVLVPLCGKSLDLLWLAEQGHEVIGVELSKVAVLEFFEELKLKPEVRATDRYEVYSTENLSILCGDFFDVTSEDLGNIVAVYDRAALVALPTEMRQRYASHLQMLTPQLAATLLLTFEYDSKVFQGPPFSVDRFEVERLFADRFNITIVEERSFQLPGVEATEVVFQLERQASVEKAD